jgi:hypothetical protein
MYKVFSEELSAWNDVATARCAKEFSADAGTQLCYLHQPKTDMFFIIDPGHRLRMGLMTSCVSQALN